MDENVNLARQTLYNDYNPDKDLFGPMQALYRAKEGELAGRAVFFAGPLSSSPERVNVWFSDLLTGELHCCSTSREGLRTFERIVIKDLTPQEQTALEGRARGYAVMCKVFGEVGEDPNAGKGPEHFFGVDMNH